MRKAPVHSLSFYFLSFSLNQLLWLWEHIGCAGAASSGGPGGPVRPVRSPGPLRGPLYMDKGASQIRIISPVPGRAADTEIRMCQL